MTTLSDLLATPVMQTLGLTLVHFLWEGTLVALVVAVLLYALKDSSASARYLVSCAGLAVMSLFPIATFILLAPSVKPVYQFTDSPRDALQAANIQPSATATMQTATAQVSDTSAKTTAIETPAQKNSATHTIFSPRTFKIYLPWLVALWLTGVLVLSVRLIGGLWLARQLRTKATRPVSEMLELNLRELASKLNISKNVRLRESLAVKVPVVIGWLRPVILLPSSAITGLSVKQLELILAHELAHIHRHDYIVNLLQKIAETLLFYHPAVWWLSGVIRQERENCCDDLAIALCESDRLLYAKTLTLLDGMRPSNAIALAADGGSLLRRIQRLAGKPMNTNYPAQWFVGVLMLLVPWVVLSVATAQAKLPTEIAENIDAFVESRLEVSGAPGIQVAIIQDGEVAFSKAYGLADIENNTAMTTDTLLPVGMEWGFYFAMLAVKQAVDKGLLNYDDTVSELLPWLHLKEGEEAKITVQNLIDGEAYIVDDFNVEGLFPFSYKESTAFDPEIKTTEEYFRSLKPENLYTGKSRQGTFVHNDLLLMLMVEKVVGIPFQDYMRQNIFEPLEINAVYGFENAEKLGASTLYDKKNGVMETKAFVPPNALSASIGLYMSSQDAAKFLISALERDPRILSEKIWKDIAPKSSEMPDSIIQSNNLDQNLFGIVDGTGLSAFLMEFSPDKKRGFVAFTNFRGDNGEPIFEMAESVRTAFNFLNGEISKPNGYAVVDKTRPNPGPKTIEHVSGKYISPLGEIELFGVGDELHGRILGHEFRLTGAISNFRTQSDYEPLDGLTLNAYSKTIQINNIKFAFKVE